MTVCTWLFCLLPAVPVPALAAADFTSLTLQAALREARQANAALPVARQQVEGAEARLEAARGARYPRLSVDGDLHGGTPQRYASNDALVQLTAQTSLYDGGRLRAGVQRSAAEAGAARAGYRMTERDLDYAVRVAFGQVLHARTLLTFRHRALERLQSYLAVVEARRRGGQAVGADVLRTRQRIASARGDIAAALRGLHEGNMTLNDLMGRSPDAPLTLDDMPAPRRPSPSSGRPWLQTPDVMQANQNVRAGEAGVTATRAGRRPHVALEADVGTQPSFSSGPSPLNNGNGSGAEVLLTFSLPLWDKGVYAGRMAEANAALGEARDRREVVSRAARLAFERAVSDANDMFNEYRARDKAAAAARDAYLEADSLYRGGQGSALAVLDAYDAWIQAVQARLDIIYAYRVAVARLNRWGAR